MPDPNVPPKKKSASPEALVRKFERMVVEEIHVEDTQDVLVAKRRERIAGLKVAALWVGLWALLTTVGLAVRGAWSPDETRWLATAWEMWARGSFVVPTLNGDAEPVPPLLFWLMNASWRIAGVSELGARLVPALGLASSLFVVARLAALLWPEEREVARYAPVLLLGSVGVLLIAGIASPDTWALFFVLVYFWSLLLRWRRRDMRAWLLAAPALAGGVLTTGLVMLVYVLPVALTAPLWARAPRPGWRHWYADVFKALMLAAVVIAAWLMLVGRVDGVPTLARYLAHAWDGAPLESLARTHPWWWCVAVLPLACVPWSVMPLAWMRLWHIRREPLDDGFVFCLTWLTLPLAALALLPGQQAQWVLPLVPAGALLASRLLLAQALREVYVDKAFAGMALPLLLTGGAMMVLSRLPHVDALPALLSERSPLLGLAVMGVGIATAWLPIKNVRTRVVEISALGVLLTIAATVAVGLMFDAYHRRSDIGPVLAEAQALGRPVAVVGAYRGEFHFAGRLRVPLAVIDATRLPTWATAHANGVIVTDSAGARFPGATLLRQAPFRDGTLFVYGLSVEGAPGS